MIFISAGHHFNPNGADPGAVATHGGKVYKEADLTRQLRDAICSELGFLKAAFISDKDTETLPQYLERIKPGSGSVVFDIHFNSSERMATGTEVIVRSYASATEKVFAGEICQFISNVTGLKNRGVKTEAQSKRGKLAMLNTKAGVSLLAEICFINNPADLREYQDNMPRIAHGIAEILVKAERAFS